MSGRLDVVTDREDADSAPLGATRLVSESVYLAFDPEMPAHELQRQGEIVTAAASMAAVPV